MLVEWFMGFPSMKSIGSFATTFWLWLMYLFVGIGIVAFVVYLGSTVLLFVQSLRRSVARAGSRFGGLFSDENETREVNYIAARIACDELNANGCDLNSEEGQKMVFAGATAHILDAAYEYDCRWDVRFTRWIRGLPPRRRFASAVATLREIHKEAQLRRDDAPESEQELDTSRDSEKPQ
jgi:hypothetical protein